LQMSTSLLGGLSQRAFFARHWQKKPLFVPGALPQFADLVTPAELMEIARQEDVQARLVMDRGGQWTVKHAPLLKADFRGLRHARWSLLVQGIDTILPQGKALLQAFSFIPYARLDDLMISFSPVGGGVGPHFDSYDVFLLQGLGHKRWQISGQADRRLIPDAPLRILKSFRKEQEWTVEAGDLLYLPPKYAHYGVALDDCLTYSIGFRAPSAQELVGQFLQFLEEGIQATGSYQDPDLVLQAHPAQLNARMVGRVAEMLSQIRWGKGDVASFLGRYLTEPKPHVFFEPPARRLSRARFASLLERRGVRLCLKTQMLFHSRSIFINGEEIHVSTGEREMLIQLADRRELPGFAATSSPLGDLLFEWYNAGYIELPHDAG
jgi:50S ribosomal protein L16 3-hydroxylase